MYLINFTKKMFIGCLIFGALSITLITATDNMFYLVFLLCLNYSVSFLINTSLQSPCPHVFQYQTRNDFYNYGLLTVPSPPLNRSAVSLVAQFVLRGRLPTVIN